MQLKFSRVFLFAVISLAVACGDDGGANPPVDAPLAIDAPSSSNALGQPCAIMTAGSCPAAHACTGIMGVGSTTMGYCSPMCNAMDALCSTGYTGPAGGTPRCVLSTAQGAPATLCAIICTANTQCPTGLMCLPVPGQPQPVSICAPPA